MSNPGKDLNEIFSGAMLSYLCLEFLARYFSQSMPQPFLEPYLHLPVPKKKLAHFAQILSLGSIFNFLAPAVILLFGINTLLSHGKILVFIAWTLPPIIGVICVHFLILLVRNKLGKNWLYSSIILGFLAALFTLKYFDYIDLKPISLFLFFKNPWGLAILLLLLVLLYYFTHSDQLQDLYYHKKLDAPKKWTTFFDSVLQAKQNSSIDKLLIFNEIKLLYRNKRTLTLLILQLIFIPLAYVQFITLNNEFRVNAIQFYVMGVCMSSLSYLQLAIKYDSRFWEKYLTVNLSLSNYLRSKFYVAYLLALVSSVFLIGIAFMNFELYILCMSFSFFLITSISIGYIGIATMHDSGFDLNGSAMYFGGFSLKQILLNMVITFTPVLIFIPFVMLDWFYGGAIFFGIAGIICFLLREQFIKEFVPRYHLHKYKMLEGFRKMTN
jgi:hypothetical protein